MRIPRSKPEAERMIEELELQNSAPDMDEGQIEDNLQEIEEIKQAWQLQ